MLGEVVSAISIWDRLVRAWKIRKTPKPETIATRFVQVFEQHGVHRNQIPRFFDHGLVLADVQDDTALLSKLTEEMLIDVCELFAIRREWLDGASDQIHPTHDFYKWPEEFAKFLDELKQNNTDGRLIGILVAPSDNKRHANALIVLQETIGFVGDRPIYRFHLCNNGYFAYWKARAYLAACIAAAWKRNVYIHGIYRETAFIKTLEEGYTLLGWGDDGGWGLGHRQWDPEYMAYDPQLYLEGVAPETDNFGITSALSLWLELAKKGLMDTGHSPSIEAFENEYAKFIASPVEER